MVHAGEPLMADRPGSSAPPGRWRYAAVLAASLLVAASSPFTGTDEGVFDVLFSLLIGAVLLLAFDEKDQRQVAFLLGASTFVGIWLGHAVPGSVGRAILLGAHVSAAGFFAFALYGILRGILVKQASGNALFGAVCGYVLLGVIWSVLYSAVESAVPGSFRMPAAESTTMAGPDRGLLSYYSFVTLTTVGYGDITPATPLARTLAWMESLAGQLYLAILVAGLVGYKVSQAIQHPGPEKARDDFQEGDRL
jgi:voltage-gated potassium channel